jgi:hypothetical protein
VANHPQTRSGSALISGRGSIGSQTGWTNPYPIETGIRATVGAQR